MAHYQYRPQSGAFSHPPSYGHYANANPNSSQQRPPPVLRQKSEFKSLYPMTKWCATYINTKSNDSTGDWADDKVDLTSPIPPTNVRSLLSLRNRIFADNTLLIISESPL